MPINAQDSGFLSRWSRRKELARQGVEVADALPAVPAAPVSVPVSVSATDSAVVQSTSSVTAAPPVAVDAAVAAPSDDHPPATQAAPEPPPTLADVALLNQDSDFRRFVGRSVQPDVKNAALAKLFRDPHFNVMDRLDVYIDDYGKPDPIPSSMLRQMLQAQVLGLFDDEDKPLQTSATAPAASAADPDPAVPTDAAALVDPHVLPCPETALPTELAADENTDLQLQPDDDPGRPGPATGAGQDAGCSH